MGITPVLSDIESLPEGCWQRILGDNASVGATSKSAMRDVDIAVARCRMAAAGILLHILHICCRLTSCGIIPRQRTFDG
jgi:hypothetical protein